MFTLLQNLALCVPLKFAMHSNSQALKPPAQSVETLVFIGEILEKLLNNFQAKGQ